METDGRPGPRPLPEDSWDGATTGLHGQLRRHRRSRRYLWVGLIFAVTALVSTVGVRLLPSNTGRDGVPEPAAVSGPDRPPSNPAADSSAGLGGLATAPPSSPQSPVGSASPGAATTAPFLLVVEAEAPTVRLRRAQIVPVDGASGGLAVRFTGTSGEVWISSLAVPRTGTYRVTVVYAPGGASSGDLHGDEAAVPVSYAAGTGCCASVTVPVVLAPGGSLHIGLSVGQGAFPAIDRVLIEA